MFLVVPLVEFRRVLGVDIDVHHKNAATFLCHVSASSVMRGRRRVARLVDTRSLTPGTQERHETPTGDIPEIPGLLSAIFRLSEAHRNEIRAQLASQPSAGGTTRLKGRNGDPRRLVAKQLQPYRFAWPQTGAATIHEHNRTCRSRVARYA